VYILSLTRVYFYYFFTVNFVQDIKYEVYWLWHWFGCSKYRRNVAQYVFLLHLHARYEVTADGDRV